MWSFWCSRQTSGAVCVKSEKIHKSFAFNLLTLTYGGDKLTSDKILALQINEC